MYSISACARSISYVSAPGHSTEWRSLSSHTSSSPHWFLPQQRGAHPATRPPPLTSFCLSRGVLVVHLLVQAPACVRALSHASRFLAPCPQSRPGPWSRPRCKALPPHCTHRLLLPCSRRVPILEAPRLHSTQHLLLHCSRRAAGAAVGLGSVYPHSRPLLRRPYAIRLDKNPCELNLERARERLRALV